MPCNSSSFFAWGILNLSKLKEELKLKVNLEIDSILLEFENKCPSPERLALIIDIRNALIEKIQKVLNRVEALAEFTEEIRPYATVVSGIITTLKLLPVPNAYTTAGLVVTFGDLLADAKDLVKSLADGICDFDSIIGRTEQELGRLVTRLEQLDALIANCIEEDINLTAVPVIQLTNNTVTTEGFDYKGYTIRIQRDPQSPSIAPRRFAVALNRNNVVVLKGQPSFSSSTQVLIDEIKFRIDQLLG